MVQLSAAPSEVLTVANCSGFYGDRLTAAREMVEGGPIDVLTGDYLAELTLLLLRRDLDGNPEGGYAKTFPLQLRQVARACLDRGIRIVVNAGGLNPAGCAAACRSVYQELGLRAKVAYIEGDDLLPRLEELQLAGEEFRHLERGQPLKDLEAPVLSANAYLGGWGIAAALEQGADLVICPRVTDASLVLGPAAWKFGWCRSDWNQLAGAVAAGHILECGAQATGGNFSFFTEVEGLEQPGFPLAEIARDGTFVVTKHPGTGGRVSLETVTAQLLYEIGPPEYLNPDVTAHFDHLELSQVGPDRVLVRGVMGSPPPPKTKVCINYPGGYKNRVTFLLSGLDLEEKAALVERSLWRAVGGQERFSETRSTLHKAAQGEPMHSEETLSFLTLSVKGDDPRLVGRSFSAAAVELALASYPGFNLTAPPGRGTAFGIYWPTLVAREAVSEVVLMEQEITKIDSDWSARGCASPSVVPRTGVEPAPRTSPSDERCEVHPLGRIVGARSGDKGGNANLGVWARSEDGYAWLVNFLTNEQLRDIVPEARGLELRRYLLPNLRAINFVLVGLLGDGVAASLAADGQAKGLGEFLRAYETLVPTRLLL